MHYFAYGSNLLEERLKLHVPSARCLGVGKLKGWQRVFHLRSQDGSAKCDLIRATGADDELEGAVYEIDPAERPGLDAWEGLGVMYTQETAVADLTGAPTEVFFYIGNRSFMDPALRPYDWYLASVVAGARRLGLKDGTQRELMNIATWPDPDTARSERNWSLIPAELH